MHREVLERIASLNLAPFAGFIYPRYFPVEENGEIVDVLIEYQDDFVAQMLNDENNYSFLPPEN